MRHHELRTSDDIAALRYRVWVASVDQRHFVDYSTAEKAEAAGFPGRALIADDWSRCQAEGERLRKAGYAGVVAPSAALPSVLNLTIFGPRVMSPWARPRRLARSIPTVLVAVGAPPAHLLGMVRYFA
jgi:RES domain-containing protein